MNEWIQCDQWICNRFFVFRCEKSKCLCIDFELTHTHWLVVESLLSFSFSFFFCTRTKNSIKSNACLMKGIKRKTESSLNRWKLTFFPFCFFPIKYWLIMEETEKNPEITQIKIKQNHHRTQIKFTFPIDYGSMIFF